MLDYAQWVQRAFALTYALNDLPGSKEVKVTRLAPPMSQEEFAAIADSLPLPIPSPLREFWLQGSADCQLTYTWDLPEEFHAQFEVAFPEAWYAILRGGANFIPTHEYRSYMETFADFAEMSRDDDYPRDAQLFGHSLPLVALRNGDFVGLYVADSVDEPTVAFLCHEGGGCSEIIAASFDEFLLAWEAFGYIEIDELMKFLHPETGLIDPKFYGAEAEAVQSLLRGELRTDMVKPQRAVTEDDWLSSSDAQSLLQWLEGEGKLDARKLRLFNCACCRRVFDRMGKWSRKAVEVAERYADGLASDSELQAARLGLAGGERGGEIQSGMSPAGVLEALLADPEKYMREGPPMHILDEFSKSLDDSMAFSKTQGMMHSAAYATIDGNTMVTWDINQHLDDAELQQEQAAQVDLLHHIFSNPFRPAERPVINQAPILQFALRLYEGENCAAELHAALRDGGYAELAKHFLRPDHPKGCWALDAILGK